MYEELMRDLLVERFAPRPEPSPRAPAPDAPVVGDGGSDTEIAIARRRRELCEALDDVPQTFRRGRRSA